MSLTKIEANEIRVQNVLPYLQNTAGLTLDNLLHIIDTKLRDASPDAMAPGLINWSNKDLFVEKWIKNSGAGLLTCNVFGLSKIGKGRYEISGSGVWEYDRFVPVSDTRGATGKIYIGANNLNATITVGVNCYDENKTLLGTNGGFIVDGFVPSNVNEYTFFKSSVFGESASGLNYLKPGTRFVKLYVQVQSNTGIVFFDESELTTFELDERYLQIFSNELDWNHAEFFYSELTTDTTFTFKNDLNGRCRTIGVKNTGSSNINVYFPNGEWQGGAPLTLISPGKKTMFTFIKMGGIISISAIEEMG